MGLVEYAGVVRRPNIDGRMNSVPAYRLVKKKKGKAE
jgi:hypothetical protein